MAADKEPKKKGKTAGQMAIWVILLLLILGLGGFGVTNFSGSVQNVGAVGTKDIPVETYARALQEQIRAIEAQTGQSLSFDQAQSLGLVDQTLSQVITARAFDHETDELGISVGDQTVAEQIRDIPAFQGMNGSFDREAYKFALDRAGLTEARFETSLREETARSILQGAVASGNAVPDTYADTLLDYLGERRRITWARLDESNLDAPIPDPSEEELKTFYDENIDRYMIPERKRITYALLTPDMLLDTMEVDQALLDQTYEDRRDEFERPERRLVERLVFSDEDAATAARERIETGEIDFETLVEQRGLSLSDIDMGDVTQSQLGRAGEEVFGAASGDVVGPLPTDLGPALFRVNGIFPAQTTDKADAMEILREELATGQARRAVETRMEPVEDMLAGGATLEELAEDTEMELGTIDWYEGLKEGIAAYDGFDATAEALAEGDYPELEMLDDGGIFAMRLEGTEPAEPAPFEDVRSRVRASWETQETLAVLRARAETYRDQLAESATFESLGLDTKTEDGVTRSGNVLGTGGDFVERVFGMDKGELLVTEGFGAVQIVRLDDILAPDLDDPATAELREGLKDSVAQNVGQDLFNAFATDIRNRAGVRLDQSAINAVHANFR
ncbi:peptidyl-prolyl cis-trans isomerase [Pseudooceanicola nanhaiensis]|jgi:peptidyl-prolyl cis-trans isomerase D|uniref:Peptidyl-prolyl cis-trans isomerase n=1 Tax=Pseudooceanicola nanhaiensis TaxID=375761 RepID=A0A917WC08_9RHOB|nr:SurA N-terminal domain-containing protein [Pseudooceanicola nanhaiensis]GGL93021.1 peptidyl-prolyl cis-trans isomerase [Pseudooceanicola nanhaiensis]